VKSFFAGMNFPRAIILIGLLSSIGLGWMLYQNRMRLNEVHLELRRAPDLIKEIQELGVTLNKRLELKAKEGLTINDDPEFYIRKIAAMDKVQIGDVNITRRESTPSRGIVDRNFRIRPDKKDRPYNRAQISNFLYQLEFESRRVRVTSLKLEPIDRVKAGETGADRWTFETEITTRALAEDT